MRLSFSPVKSRIQRPFAAMLVLWFGGLGCLLGCINDARAASYDESGAAQHGGMSMSGGMASGQMVAGHHECCRARRASSRRASKSKETTGSLTTSPSSSSHTQCCPLSAAGVSGVAHKPRAAVEATQTFLFNAAQSWLEMQTQAAPSNDSLSLPNRGHTRLLGCVFLI
jgi:hypothetical protein